jgi:carbamoyl-phosphate synthase large subunit
MGIDSEFGSAYAKAQLGAGQKLPASGTVFISVMDRDKSAVLSVAKGFSELGFRILATRGTALFLNEHDVANEQILKISIGRPNVVDAIKNRQIQLIINTGTGGETKRDGYLIRRAAIKYSIPYATTTAGAMAMCRGIEACLGKALSVKTIQEFNSEIDGLEDIQSKGARVKK